MSPADVCRVAICVRVPLPTVIKAQNYSCANFEITPDAQMGRLLRSTSMPVCRGKGLKTALNRLMAECLPAAV